MSDVRMRHWRNGVTSVGEYCVGCEQPWPCDAIREAERADKAEAKVRELDEFEAHVGSLGDIQELVQQLERTAGEQKILIAQSLFEVVTTIIDQRDEQTANLRDTLRLLKRLDFLIESALCWIDEGPDNMPTKDVLACIKKDVRDMYKATVENPVLNQPWAQEILNENK